MSVKGRVYPFRVVINPQGRKPHVHLVQGDRENAENVAAEVQTRGTRAEVVLVQGKTRTVVTEYPAAEFDLDFDPDGRTYFVRYHLAGGTEHGVVTGKAHDFLFESAARRAARVIQRAGGSAEIVRGNTVSSVYPALTGEALAGVAELTYEEGLEQRNPSLRPHTTFERVRHAADCVSLNLTLLCDEDPATADEHGVMTGSCLTGSDAGASDALAAEEERRERALDRQRLAELETEGPLSRQLRALAETERAAGPVQFCPSCGEPANVTHDPDPENDGDAECTSCDWVGCASEVNDEPKPTPGVTDELAEEVPDDSCTVGPEHRYALVHEDDVRQYRCTAPGCGAETYEEKTPAEPAPLTSVRRCPKCAMRITEFTPHGDPEVTCPAEDCDWTGGVDQLDRNHGNAPAPERPSLAERRAAFRRDMDRAADDAEVALGRDLGRALGTLLRTLGSYAEHGQVSGILGARVRRVADLVTERATEHRNTPRGGNGRRELDRLALDAYSERFEGSRREVRDHQAAMRDAIDAVFDGLARGSARHRVLIHPEGGMAVVGQHHFASVRADDGALPWEGTGDSGRWSDHAVANWWEMAPTGRVFIPEKSAGSIPAPDDDGSEPDA